MAINTARGSYVHKKTKIVQFGIEYVNLMLLESSYICLAVAARIASINDNKFFHLSVKNSVERAPVQSDRSISWWSSGSLTGGVGG